MQTFSYLWKEHPVQDHETKWEVAKRGNNIHEVSYNHNKQSKTKHNMQLINKLRFLIIPYSYRRNQTLYDKHFITLFSLNAYKMFQGSKIYLNHSVRKIFC